MTCYKLTWTASLGLYKFNILYSITPVMYHKIVSVSNVACGTRTERVGGAGLDGRGILNFDLHMLVHHVSPSTNGTCSQEEEGCRVKDSRLQHRYRGLGKLGQSYRGRGASLW